MGLVSSLLAKLLRNDTAASAERRLAMSDADLNQIEASLEVRLPESYRSVMLALPIGQYDGYSLHEDVSKIVSRTKEQRSGGRRAKRARLSGGVGLQQTNDDTGSR
jgi:hypothetical protein